MLLLTPKFAHASVLWRIQDSPEGGGSFSYPKIWWSFLLISLITLFLPPQNLMTFFSHHSLQGVRFLPKSPKTTKFSPLPTIASKNISLSLRGFFHTQRTPWIRLCDRIEYITQSAEWSPFAVDYCFSNLPKVNRILYFKTKLCENRHLTNVCRLAARGC